MDNAFSRWAARLPFYYGWVIIVVAFVTMAVAVTARTSFSLLMPPLIDEFGWDRGLAAGAFSFGFLVSAIVSPISGRVMDGRGPRVIIECGVLLSALGLFMAPLSVNTVAGLFVATVIFALALDTIKVGVFRRVRID